MENDRSTNAVINMAGDAAADAVTGNVATNSAVSDRMVDMKTREMYAAIDIGGTKIKYGLINGLGSILEKSSMDTEAQLVKGPGILQKVQDIVAGFSEKTALSGICISSAGMVDVEKGAIFDSGPQIPDYAGLRFKEILEKRFGIPCEMENDVNCAGLSESVLGAGRGRRSCLCLTIGTGIGGAFVCGGEVYHGASGSACEVGYMKLPGGDFQDQGAASVLSRRVESRKGEATGSWDGLRIFEAAKAGDPVCVEEIDRLCDCLGMGIANICYVLNPQIVVLGGGIMQQKEYLLPRLRAALDRYLVPSVAKHTELQLAENGNDAGMLGAFLHFRLMQKKRQEGAYGISDQINSSGD